MAEDKDGGRKLRMKERKKYIDQDLDEDDIDGKRSYSLEEKLECDKFDANIVEVMTGPEFTMEWMQRNGLVRPIVFYDKTGLGLRVPSENFKVSDVKQCVGSRRILDVMDVTTQKALEMSMKEWVKYYENPERSRLLNVISLEFCNTRLENYVESPTLVRQIDWVDRAWPKHLKECQTESTNLIEKMMYPKVQKYCLMSVGGCYTDWHVDFGGTSVWYHILHGEKIFWLAPPSPKNMDSYVDWTLSAKQGDSFLGDSLEQCQRIQLKAGYTFIIPSGWIHAVYTPQDSLVFGGNFLHSFNIEEQLLVSKVETKTYVPGKFRYPYYLEIMWYVVDRYLCCLTGRTYLSSHNEKDETEEDDQGLIQVDEDSRPPSRNPDSRPPSRSMIEDNEKGPSGEETPKLSKSVTIELTRIDATLNRSQSEEETGRSHKTKSRKSSLDPSLSWDGGGPRKYVYLTVREMNGIKQLIDYLTGLLSLPVSKRGIPKNLLDPEAVLRELKHVLEEHRNDDQKLAMSGDPSFGWPEHTKKKQKMKLGYKTFKTAKTPKGEKGEKPSGIRRRRTRCKKCEACTRTECGECNFCKDMKKFGGPGRMKQTCISRQCMAPILPSSSVCLICNQEGKVNPEDPDDVSMLLMECGICWEIVHPACLQKKYENLDSDNSNINEDLPNSWECLKCCNAGKQGQLKPRVKPGFSIRKLKGEDHRSSIDSDGSHEDELSSRLSPVEGKRIVSKQEGSVGSRQQLIKSETMFIKSEANILTSENKWHSLSETKPTIDTKLLTPDRKSPIEVKRGSSDIKMKQEPGREENHKKKAYSNGKEPHRKHLKKEQESQDETPRAGRKRQTSLTNLKNISNAVLSESASKRPKREILDEGRMGDDYHSNSSHSKKARQGSKSFKHGYSEGGSSFRESSALSFSSSSSSAFSTPSPWSNPQPHHSLIAPSIQSQDQNSPESQFKDSSLKNIHLSELQQTSLISPEKSRWGVDYAPKVPLKNYVIHPAPPALIPDFVMTEAGIPHRLPHCLWMLVFRYLSQADLVRLSATCRTFDCWALDPVLWPEINLSLRSIKQAHLKFVMLRQPASLKLASCVISYQQLSWLIARLPGVKFLDLSNLSWASICALCSSDCPLLHSLNLSWATGIRDLCFRELASPPVNLKPGQRNISRLCRLERLSLTGTDINDGSLEVIAAHLPKLSALDLTCCMRVTDRGIRALVQLGAPCLLREIRLVKCVQLTERCLESLSQCRELSFLALTDIPAISQEACVRFSRNYRHRTLRAHAHGIVRE